MSERTRRPHPFRSETRHATVARTLTVRSVESLATDYVRIVLGGTQLGAFTDEHATAHPAMVSTGFDDVAVLFFADAHGTVHSPLVFADGRLLPNPNNQTLAREYTVFELDVAADRLVIDVVLHESGIASDWARTTAANSKLLLVGPRVSRGLPRSRSVVAIGDSSAIPALTRLAALLPTASIIASVGEGLRSLLPPHATYVSGDADLEATISALTDIPDNADTTYWIAGESSFATGLRRHLVNERGIARTRIQFTGYWRTGAAGLLEHAPEDA